MRLLNILGRLLSFAVAIFLCLSLVSHHADDVSSWYATSHAHSIQNWCGAFGAEISAWALHLFGSAAYIFILLFVVLGIYGGRSYRTAGVYGRVGALAALLPCVAAFFALVEHEWYRHIAPGGLCGKAVLAGCDMFLDPTLVPIVIYAVLWSSIFLMTGVAWVSVCLSMMQQMSNFLMLDVVMDDVWRRLMVVYALLCGLAHRYRKYSAWWVMHDARYYDDIEQLAHDTFQECAAGAAILSEQSVVHTGQVASEMAVVPAVTMECTAQPVQSNITATTYRKPDMHVTWKSKHQNDDVKAIKNAQQDLVRILEDKLKRFGIKGAVTSIISGPVVTFLEYQPHVDVPLSKIIARENDLALALQAMSLRLIAPVPGKSVVGFEIANGKRKMVHFAECAMAPEFTKGDASLPLIIGQTTVGEYAGIDLASMPHLLVAGSTGSGKSVALNSMILSILCRATPAEVRLILIDPKRLEFSAYADIPHLVFPIVTDPKMALRVLEWALKTMEERYEQMAQCGARNIYDYRALSKGSMPYIVIIIDELADLMMVVGREIEGTIARLAQMARAAGIHLIVATQRPSVDVITGVIKINFPARLACKVISKIDSRTILDGAGAEKLLGKGDMLFLDPQGRLIRLHGAYVSNEEIEHIVSHVKLQQAVVYEQLLDAKQDATLQGEDAALFQELLLFVKTVDEISISLVQRKFRIGYNRSARMIDVLESRGLIVSASGGKTRKVLH